jgi:hypothetical protein
VVWKVCIYRAHGWNVLNEVQTCAIGSVCIILIKFTRLKCQKIPIICFLCLGYNFSYVIVILPPQCIKINRPVMISFCASRSDISHSFTCIILPLHAPLHPITLPQSVATFLASLQTEFSFKRNLRQCSYSVPCGGTENRLVRISQRTKTANTVKECVLCKLCSY